MAHVPHGGLGTVLDLGGQLRLDPDSLMRNPLGVGLRLALPSSAKPAMVSVSRCAQVIFTQSLPRPEG